MRTAVAAIVSGSFLLLAAGCSAGAGADTTPPAPAAVSASESADHSDHSGDGDHADHGDKILGTDGPLVGPRDASGILCNPPADGARIVFGDHFTNTGDKDVTLTGVRLNHPEGLADIEYSAVPDVTTLGSYAGIRDDKPTDPAAAATWEARVDVEGLVVPPGTTTNVLTAATLADAGASGSSAGLIVEYTVGSDAEIEISTWTYKISTDGC